MAPVLAPWQAGHEIACCLYLGALVGALRALAPARGRWAFVPGAALVGLLLLFLQSYAAGYSDAGSLRWYMVLAGFVGALVAHSLLGPLAGQAWRALLWPGRALGRWAGRNLLAPARPGPRPPPHAPRPPQTAQTPAENPKKNDGRAAVLWGLGGRGAGGRAGTCGPPGAGPCAPGGRPAAPGKRQKRRQKTKKRACKTSGICCIIHTYNTSVVRSLIHRRRTQWHGPVRRQKRSGGR